MGPKRPLHILKALLYDIYVTVNRLHKALEIKVFGKHALKRIEREICLKLK